MSEGLLTAIASGIFFLLGGVCVALINARAGQMAAIKKAQEQAREDIVRIGEWLLSYRNDSAKISLLFNQMFREFEQETGHKPEIDFELFAQMTRFEYKSGPLGPLEIK